MGFFTNLQYRTWLILKQINKPYLYLKKEKKKKQQKLREVRCATESNECYGFRTTSENLFQIPRDNHRTPSQANWKCEQ